jgi:PAS domain S-box-containing protein
VSSADQGLTSPSFDPKQELGGTPAPGDSEALLAGVLDSSLDGIAALKAIRNEGGQIVDFTWLLLNRRAEQLLGRTATEMLGRRLLETLPANRDLGLFDAYIRVVETGAPAEHEFHYEADGIRAWFQNIAAKFGDGFTVTFRDITRQKRAEETRLALAAAQMGSWEFNLRSESFTSSPGAALIFGFAPDGPAPPFDEYLARIRPEDRARLRAELGKTARAGGAHSVEFRVQPPGAPQRWVISRGATILDDEGRPRSLMGVLTDITERMLAEERAERLLRVTTALARAVTVRETVTVVLEHAAEALGATAGGAALFAPDRASLELTVQWGYPPERQLDAHIPVTAPTPLAAAARDGRAAFLTGPELAARYPEAPAAAAGSCACLPLQVGERTLGALILSFPGERAFSPAERTFLSSLAGQCAQAVDRAAIYETERASRAAAEEALFLRDQFLAAAAHELRTPLTVLLGSADLLARRAERSGVGESREARAARSIARQVARLDRLFNLMLDVTILQAGRLTLDATPLDLTPLVAGVVGALQPTLGHHTVALDAPAPVWVRGDLHRLERVVQELLDNAVRYSPGGGPVEVSVWAGDELATVRVRDRGIGVPAEALPRVFERYFRASNVDVHGGISGLGLGLSLAHAIVELHGGTITMRSDEGNGSEVMVGLPLLDRELRDARAGGTGSGDAEHPGS